MYIDKYGCYMKELCDTEFGREDSGRWHNSIPKIGLIDRK